MTDPNTNVSPQDAAPPTGLNQGAILFGEAADKQEAALKEAPTPDDPKVAELKGQLDAMSKQIEQMQQTNMTLMMQPAQAAPMPLPAAVPTLDPLPDVVDDAEGFANKLAERITQQVDAKMAAAQGQATAQQSAKTKYDGLWDAFKGKHEAYSGDYRRVKFAANIAAENLAKQNIDVEKYMFSYQDKFMADVITVMDDIFGKPGAKVNDPPASPAPKDPDRTGGLFSGTDSAGGVTPDVIPGSDEDPFGDIREWQQKTGFHR